MRSRSQVSAFLGILKGGMAAGGRTTQCPTTRPAVSEICLGRWNGCFFGHLRLRCMAGDWTRKLESE